VLFGNILGISTVQMQTTALISVGAILLLLLIARPLLFASLDPDVAAAQEVPSAQEKPVVGREVGQP
jgi:zinc/manganese transport system permease protein